MGINDSNYEGKGRAVQDFEGTHALELFKLEEKISRADNAEIFLAHFMCHGSSNDELQRMIDKNGGNPIQIAHVSKMGRYKDYYYTDQKNILGALYDVDPSNPNPFEGGDFPKGWEWQDALDAAKGGDKNGTYVVATCIDTGKKFEKGKKVGQPIINASYKAYAEPEAGEGEAAAS